MFEFNISVIYVRTGRSRISVPAVPKAEADPDGVQSVTTATSGARVWQEPLRGGSGEEGTSTRPQPHRDSGIYSSGLAASLTRTQLCTHLPHLNVSHSTQIWTHLPHLYVSLRLSCVLISLNCTSQWASFMYSPASPRCLTQYSDVQLVILTYFKYILTYFFTANIIYV